MDLNEDSLEDMLKSLKSAEHSLCLIPTHLLVPWKGDRNAAGEPIYRHSVIGEWHTEKEILEIERAPRGKT